MLQTFLTIPHYVFEGWLMAAWLVIGLCIAGYLVYRHGLGTELWNFATVFLVVAAIIYFVLPQLEVAGINPDDPEGPRIKSGLKIRGYGFFMLLGMVCGGSLVLYRSLQIGLDPDRMMTLMFWMIVAGILGARLFYIIQKWDEFHGESLQELAVKLLDMTKGGLVVYGSLVGGVLATLVYIWRTGLPVAKVADALAPGMVIGLAFGRIGCLMNGCCFGGVCDTATAALEFPPASPPYMRQLATGDLLGMKLAFEDREDDYPYLVGEVSGGGLAERAELRPGDRINVRWPDSEELRAAMEEGLPIDSEVVIYARGRPDPIRIPHQQLPRSSLPTHPTQVYSAVNAALLCLLLWFFYPFRQRDGQVFALLLILYSIGRFLLETIREDEPGFWGTPLTISQWVSIFALAAGLALMAWLYSYGAKPIRAPSGLPGDQPKGKIA